MEALFRPDGDWQRLPAVAVVSHRVNSTVVNLIATLVVTATVWILSHGEPWLVAASIVAMLSWTAWRVIRIGRWIRSFAFREGDRDLLISYGLWNQSLIAIPYGRMLSVEVRTGPISRLWHLAEVELFTASHHSHAEIPALPAEQAAALRDRLIAAGEEQALPL